MSQSILMKRLTESILFNEEDLLEEILIVTTSLN